MIEQDRELLVRLKQVNLLMGKFVVEMFEEQDGGELPAGKLRKLGNGLVALGADLVARAAELDART